MSSHALRHAASGDRRVTKFGLRAFLRQNPFPHPMTEGLFYREKMRAIHRVAPATAGLDLLEIGGGTSGLTATLYPGARLTNADADPAFASAPLNRRPGTTFVHADATQLPFADRSFDTVTLFDVLEHIRDDEAAVREVRRVLRPGGFVLVTAPNEHWRFPYHRALRRICPSESEMLTTWSHVRRGYSLAELGRLFACPPSAAATFINPLTAPCHDVAFSNLPRRARRTLCVVLSPVTWLGYALHGPRTRGTETASCWRPSAAIPV
jgi:ubiquinone/menaquinone biosynthesis C-methylase UbiE